jgi:hypothetical protein
MMTGMEDVGAEIREQAAERIRDEEATGEEQVANSPRERKLELAVTILLSVSALLSAWCAYQSTRLGSQESLYNNKSSVLQLQAFRAEEKTTLENLADLSAFERWLAATSAGASTAASTAAKRSRGRRPRRGRWPKHPRVATLPRHIGGRRMVRRAVDVHVHTPTAAAVSYETK